MFTHVYNQQGLWGRQFSIGFSLAQKLYSSDKEVRTNLINQICYDVISGILSQEVICALQKVFTEDLEIINSKVTKIFNFADECILKGEREKYLASNKELVDKLHQQKKLIKEVSCELMTIYGDENLKKIEKRRSIK